ncbi:MAG: T9SS type A sorting domain-containing protein [Flavipsychrobacter sp.]
MKIKHLLLSAIVPFLGITNIYAQAGYTLDVKDEPYEPLTNAAIMSPPTAWGFLNMSVPLGFHFKLDGTTIDSFNLFQSGNLIATGLAGTVTGFHVTDGNLCDKAFMVANPTGPSISTVTYTTTGNPGSRIFKASLNNVGFYEEFAALGTADDSANIQIWLYEGSNVIEMRYGASKISNLYGIYQAQGSMAGLLRGIDLSNVTPTFDKFYYVGGNIVIGYQLDSITPFTIPSAKPASIFPPDGTVYTFTPVNSTTGIITQAAETIQVYPTVVNDKVIIESKENLRLPYKILDMKGSVIDEGIVSNNRRTVDAHSWPKGMYILHVYGDQPASYKIYKP